MKNIVKVFAAVGTACMVLASCDNDEFLTVTQYDVLQPDVQFANDQTALMGLNGIYAYNNVSKEDNSWGYKPNLFTGSHPTMDTQCTGWDIKFLDQTWDDGVAELGDGWSHCYAAISRANLYLANLDGAQPYNEATKNGVTDACRKTLEGEAKALRGYFYTWLATTFGRVPMLQAGEDYTTTPVKASAETYDEMWDFIIQDFQDAANLLDWQPYGGQFGRCTKGMALAYLADAYMWKAYRQGCDNLGAWTQAQSDSKKSVVNDCYEKAKKALEQIINSGTYELSSNFATNWDPAGFWNKECIWAMCSDEGDKYNSWNAGDRTIGFCNPNMFKWFTACTNNGGWGSQFLSWEWYSCYESGDLRRDASCATGNIPDSEFKKWGIEPGKTRGWHPYLQCVVGPTDELTKHFHCGNGELAPSIWTTKIWRNAYADGDSWNQAMWSPTIIYGKRYANVLLDYAECCFRLGDEATGWAQINALRNRAWGNLAVGKDYSSYCAYFNDLYKEVKNPDLTLDKYPFTVDAENPAPDAKEYYTALQAKPNRVGYNHTSPAWKVAVNEERRKEFNSEWCLLPDMVKSGYIEDHINYNYPKDNTEGDNLRDYPWSHRKFDFKPSKMDMPIPSKEILKNSAIQQNPAYRSNK